MLCLRPPSPDRLQGILEERSAAPFTYPEVGATVGQPPGGYRHDRESTDLGADDGDRFQRAGQAVLDWVPQRGAGIRVFPDGAVTADQTFVLVLPLPGAGWAVAPARVVYLVDEPDRVGFAYGTLPGHPASGEEAFMVVRAAGRVRFEVIAFSRGADLLARLGGPVTRALQVRTIRTYLRSMEGAIR
jgi:uncharacterized protein (UPF0548 family)